MREVDVTDWLLISWVKDSGGVWDLTRSDRAAVTSPKLVPMSGSKKTIMIEPSRSALVIIDMQSKSNS